MKYLFAILVPLLGGCLAQIHANIPATAVAATTEEVSLAAAEPSEVPAVPAHAPAVPLPLFKPDFDNIFVDQSGIPYSLLEFDQLFTADESVEDSDEIESPEVADLADPEEAEDPESEDPDDPDALADRVILSGLEENPPQDEGETVPAATVLFDFPVVENEKVHYYVNYFSGPAKKIFARWLERSSRYLPLMQQIFVEEGLPRDLVYLALIESGFNNRAYSWAHAAGPWQFIRGTGLLYGLKSDWWHDERRDFEKATRAAARFLRDLRDRFDGDWYLALAGYNAGPGKIQKAIEMYDSRDFWEISRHSYLADETKNYVPKMLASLLIAKQPGKYGFTELDYQPPVAFESVAIPDVTDLEIVAKFCNVSYEEIRDLNPELSRWCTPPNRKNYSLRIPAGQKENFEQFYAALPPAERANYAVHRVRSGETLKKVAKKYKVRVDDIVAMNSLASKSLRVGSELILPVRRGTPVPLQELQGPPGEVRKKTYIVRKGDTLRKIARKFHVSERELKKWNRIANVKFLKPGQVLTVSAKGVKPAREKNEGSAIVYKVKSGDTLFGIASRHGVTINQIAEWNGLSRRHVLRPGQKLTLEQAKSGKTKAGSTAKTAKKADVKTPGAAKSASKKSPVVKTAAAAGKRTITYKVRPGDTLWEISRRFDVATHQIIKWNKLAADVVLRPGVKLTLVVENGKQG